MVNKTSYLNDIDTQRVTELLNDTQENVSYFESVVDQVVISYTEPLDNVMKNIHLNIIAVDNPSIDVLEKYFLELSNCIYFISEKMEHLGIYDAVSKSAYKNVYNTAYLDNQVKDANKKNKVPVAELSAIAEDASIYESTVNDIYNKAYKIVKNKIDAAQTMISTLSKIISKRMTEMQLSKMQPISQKQILNE